MKAQRVETWAAPIEDKPGALAEKFTALSTAGANLEFVIARRAPDKPGTGVVFVTPIKGAKQTKAAVAAGFQKTANLQTIRVEGTDKKGLGACLTQGLANAGVNLRGLSAAAISKKFICHIAVDTAADAAKVVQFLRKM